MTAPQLAAALDIAVPQAGTVFHRSGADFITRPHNGRRCWTEGGYNWAGLDHRCGYIFHPKQTILCDRRRCAFVEGKTGKYNGAEIADVSGLGYAEIKLTNVPLPLSA